MQLFKPHFILFLSLLLILSAAGDVIGKKRIPFGEGLTGPQLVYHIPPHSLMSMEDENYVNFVKRGLRKAIRDKAVAVIVEINTPGGMMLPTFDLSKELIEASAKIKTIAFVNSHAISAGSLIAISCDRLVMAPGGQIGGATPVMQDGSYAPKKIIEPARKKWRAAAEAKSRNADIAEQMVVDEEIIIHTNGKKEVIKSNKFKIKQMISMNLLLESFSDSKKSKKKKSKTSSLEDALKNLGKSSSPKIEYKALTLTTKEALKNKFADYKALNITEILKKEKLQNAKIVVHKKTSLESAVEFLTHPLMAALLLVIGFTGLFAEVKTPGWGVGGSVGIIFLFIYFFSRVISGYSSWGPAALAVVGIILLVLEIFVIPGFGFAGVTGLFSLIGGILWAYGFGHWQEGIIILFSAVVLAAGFIVLLVSKMKSAPGFSRMILNEVVPDSPNISRGMSHESLLGELAVAHSDLRPAGVIFYQDVRLDAVSEGGFIEAGTNVKIIEVDGNRLVVRKT